MPSSSNFRLMVLLHPPSPLPSSRSLEYGRLSSTVLDKEFNEYIHDLEYDAIPDKAYVRVLRTHDSWCEECLQDFSFLIKKDGMKAMQQEFQRMISLALGDALGAKKKDLMPLLDVVSKSCGARRKQCTLWMAALCAAFSCVHAGVEIANYTNIRTVRIVMLMAKLLHELEACDAIFVSLPALTK
nr:uncharacterized protein LOC129381871 [Dermacentor andersoni]